MNIIINQESLRRAAHMVERLVSKNVSLPILNTILLKTENGRLRLSATNLEMGINYWIAAKINQEGEVAVPARVFSDFINNIKDEKTTLVSNKNVITINSDHYQTTILGTETKDFPLIPRVKNAIQFKIDSQDLISGLNSVLDSVSLSETRPEISGVFVNILKEKVEFAATDSFRLAEKIINLNSGINKSIIIPRAAALELSKIAESTEGEITIAISDNQIFALGSDFEFISRLIDGHYPEYKKVIPEKFISSVKINKGDLERNIRLASIFSSSIFDVKLKTDTVSMQIAAKNSDRGEILASIPCQSETEPFEISVNYRYLLDGLRVIPGENILIQFTGDGSPLVLKSENEKNQTYVIMPLRS